MDEAEEWTIECPHCGADVFDDVDQCPNCQMYISAADFKKPTPWWLIIIILMTVVGFTLAAIRF
jgi:uncharacterized protein (DUF983 family)